MRLCHPNSLLQVLVAVQQSLLLEQRLTRSVRSRFEDSNLGLSGSVGGSCILSLYSKLYVMCSTTDAASTAINFSRAGVDKGIVDSPPSRGPTRTPLCSSLPLKRLISTVPQSRSLSRALRTQTTLHRKLYGSADNNDVDPRFRDLGLTTISASRPGSSALVLRLEGDLIILLQLCRSSVSPSYGLLPWRVVR